MSELIVLVKTFHKFSQAAEYLLCLVIANLLADIILHNSDTPSHLVGFVPEPLLVTYIDFKRNVGDFFGQPPRAGGSYLYYSLEELSIHFHQPILISTCFHFLDIHYPLVDTSFHLVWVTEASCLSLKAAVAFQSMILRTQGPRDPAQLCAVEAVIESLVGLYFYP